jgi:diacylglycerol kinase
MLSFLKSFGFAFRGLQFAWKGRNFRVQFFSAISVIVLGFVLKITAVEWLVISLIIGLILAFEAMNTAIEETVNLVSPEIHPLAGKIKDMAAGAVLILAFVSVVIGLIIFVPYFIRLFF